MRLTAGQIEKFRHKVYTYYEKNRRIFPWRKTKNPYHILVSEIMLQQTQADRVVSKYTAFIKQFPSARVLAAAPLSKVLRVWQGLGYNRRAKLLHAAAQTVVDTHRGRVPREITQLQALPGVGPYTAAAVAAFAYNLPSAFVETNIRTVFIHEFFLRRKKVSDKELLPLIEQTVDTLNARKWYSALMDYGTALKRQYKNPSRKSTHYARQSAFVGSTRQVRGAVVRELAKRTRSSEAQLLVQLPFEATAIRGALAALVAEGLIRQKNQTYFL